MEKDIKKEERHIYSVTYYFVGREKPLNRTYKNVELPKREFVKYLFRGMDEERGFFLCAGKCKLNVNLRNVAYFEVEEVEVNNEIK